MDLKSLSTAIAAVLVAATLSACGGDDDKPATPTTPNQPATPTQPAPGTPAAPVAPQMRCAP